MYRELFQTRRDLVFYRVLRDLTSTWLPVHNKGGKTPLQCKQNFDTSNYFQVAQKRFGKTKEES